MSPEYKAYISIRTKNDAEAERIRQAILMIKGVDQAQWNEWPTIPASEDHLLDVFIQELNSLDVPWVSAGWIRSKLPNLTKYHQRDWEKFRYVPASIKQLGRGRAKLYTLEEAELQARIWHLRERDHIAPKSGHIIAIKEMQMVRGFAFKPMSQGELDSQSIA